MKTIFLTIYDGDTEKNILRSDVFPILKKAGIKIILLVKERFIDYYQKNFADEQVIVEPLLNPTCSSEKLFFWLGSNSIPTYSVFMLRKEKYLKKHKNIIRYWVERMLGFLSNFRIWRNLLRWIYFQIPDDYCLDYFKKYKPDLVFTPNMFSFEDGRILRLAKKLKIKTITTVKSWDVLPTKAFTRVLADRILVFNDYNKKEAVDIGDYRPEQVVITGFPQFDIYTKKEILLPREEFFRKIGADPNKKLILYACSGDWKAPYDHEVLIGLHKAIADREIKEPIQVLIRFHPKYHSRAEYLKYFPYFILDRPGIFLSQDSEESLVGAGTIERISYWVFKNQDIIHLANSLYHSDILINTESTMTLDAVNFDKPVILIGYDGFQKLEYFYSIIRRYDFEHYRYILDTKGAKLAKTERDMIDYINNYLKNPEIDKEGRELLRKKMIYKCDGNSSQRVTENILNMLNIE